MLLQYQESRRDHEGTFENMSAGRSVEAVKALPLKRETPIPEPLTSKRPLETQEPLFETSVKPYSMCKPGSPD